VTDQPTSPSPADVRAAALAWLAADPDPVTRAETESLLATADDETLAARFVGRLQFGTAGIRAALGAGPQRMNRLVVRQTAAGLAADLLAQVPDAATKGVVLGGDARHGTKEFVEDFARVFAAAGIKTMRFTEPIPTPVVAYATKRLDVAAGICVTASHNPPADNGVKVYWGDGAQIVPPMDGRIAAAIDHAALSATVLTPLDHELCTLIDAKIVDDYVAGVHALDPHTSTPAERASLAVVITPMHGVGGELAMRILREAGYTNVTPVAEQFVPDPDFPTVSFPNPEEPGALDLAFALARNIAADLIVANDPDADRCALAVPDSTVAGGWRRLSGDEVGWSLATHLLTAAQGDSSSKKLLITTLVSSSLLSKMAARWNVEYVETLTGFKWLARAAMDRPDHRLILAYEEALGYCVGDLVADKDGLSAALVACDLAARCKADGSTILDLLKSIDELYGRHQTSQWSLRFDGPQAAQDMAALIVRARAAKPKEIAGCPVVITRDYLVNEPPADVLVFDLGSVGRITVRPSGTEPKCKVYFEVVAPADEEAPVTVRALTDAMAVLLGVPAE
jgi:phosphomannomutase